MKIYNIIDIIEKEPIIYNLLKCCPYEVLKHWEILKYKKGKIFLHQDEVYPYFFIIVDGKADIFVMADNGKKYTQSIYKKGNFIGELEIFKNLPYSCSIKALTDITILALKKEYFFKWYDVDKNISRYLTESICTNFHILSKKSAQDTLFPLKYRVCKYLLTQYKKLNSNIIFINKETLSGQFAVTQRSLNRTFLELKEKHIIDIKVSEIIIEDLNKLEKLLQ
ncbi:Crp/Fnr family transcriptional regulator [Clostridium botulinum]|nr:Crp/Fnr family transcriptional regulator [Clostridium botulinum]